jgi:hypothetical protein
LQEGTVLVAVLCSRSNGFAACSQRRLGERAGRGACITGGSNAAIDAGTYVARQTKPMVVRTNTKKIHWLATIQPSPPYFRITQVLFATSPAIKIMSIMAASFGFRKSRIATSGSSNVSDVQKITAPIGIPP